MKGAFDEVVSQLFTKDSLYGPMKDLNGAYSKWLEDNWSKLNSEDLEKYNKQHDQINAIVKAFDDGQDKDVNKMHEMLAELQALGSPPQDLMKSMNDQ